MSKQQSTRTGKLFTDTLEDLLYGRAVADEGAWHRETTRRDVADGGLDVIWNPLNEMTTEKEGGGSTKGKSC